MWRILVDSAAAVFAVLVLWLLRQTWRLEGRVTRLEALDENDRKSR